MNLRTALLCAAACVAGSGAVPALAAGPVSLDTALEKALRKHPALAASRAELDARDGAALQAGTAANPELELELEDLGGPGGSEVVGITLSVTQELQLGGKREKRRGAALREVRVAEIEAQARRLDLEAAVTGAFVRAQAAQERARLMEELVGVAAESLATVKERVEAGKASPIEEVQARLETATSRVELARAWAEWARARTALAATWGGEAEEVPAVTGHREELPQIPPLEQLAGRLAEGTEQLRWRAAVAAAEAAVEVERTGAVPDLALTGGVRNSAGGDETTFLVAASLPLPLFDRNQGAVATAAAELARVRAERTVAERDLRRELEEVYLELSAAREEAQVVRETLLPDARQAYAAIREGYQWGKFGYLALLDAQRTLLEARGQLIDADAAFHLAKARLDRLVAQPAGDIAKP